MIKIHHAALFFEEITELPTVIDSPSTFDTILDRLEMLGILERPWHNLMSVTHIEADTESALIITKLFANITRPGYTSFSHGFTWYGNEAITIVGNLMQVIKSDPQLLFTFTYNKD